MCIPTTRYMHAYFVMNTHIHITHVQIPVATSYTLTGEPDAAEGLSADFEEDLREEYLQHALLTLSWDGPPS